MIKDVIMRDGAEQRVAVPKLSLFPAPQHCVTLSWADSGGTHDSQDEP
jgi:hypothetical protein